MRAGNGPDGALTNVAMADAAIAVWESKFFYQFWRPVAGIREADPGTGGSDPGAATPTAGDGNPTTVADYIFYNAFTVTS